MRKVTPKSRGAWRAWLEKNHAAADEVWLVFHKRGTGKPTLSYDDAVEEALCFGWIDGIKRTVDEERYMHRFSPRKPDSNWSPSNKKRVAKLQKAGAMTPAGERLVNEAKKRGTWDAPARPDVDLSMPEEFAALLTQHPEAKAFFDGLAPSYKRQYVAWIATAKREDTRRKRMDTALKRLKAGEKLGMV